MINASDAQLIAICRGAAQRCDEQHAYMALARRDPHSWLPHKWVVDAMRDSLAINTGRLAELKAENESLRANSERYEWLKLNSEIILANEAGYISVLSGKKIYTRYPASHEIDGAVDASMNDKEANEA